MKLRVFLPTADSASPHHPLDWVLLDARGHLLRRDRTVLDEVRGMLVDDDGVGATFDRTASLPLTVRLAIDEAAGRGERPTSITVHAARSASLPDLAAWSQEAGIAFVAGGDWEAIAAGQP